MIDAAFIDDTRVLRVHLDAVCFLQVPLEIGSVLAEVMPPSGDGTQVFGTKTRGEQPSTSGDTA